MILHNVEVNNLYSKFNSSNSKQTFTGGNFTGLTKAADLFIKSQENLSSTRFIQDTATNWAPKALFTRSKADFAEMSFLEVTESAIFYFAPPLLGQKLFRNLFKKFAPKNISKQINELIPQSVSEIANNKALTANIKKRAIATKAGIVLACVAVPAAEYALSFAKNLFTLKKFKKCNFNNIANLDKTGREKENADQQKRVEKNAKYQLKKFAFISAAGVAIGAMLAFSGHKSDLLQKISKGILNPGKALAEGLKKIGLKEGKTTNILSKLSLDFANDNGKLALSKGQLGLTAILGLFGYSKAAEDRGKLDVLEVWTRVPIVVFYTIFGSELFEKAFHKILEKKNKFKDVISKDAAGKLRTPSRKELPLLAEKIAKQKGTNAAWELSRLTKEKAFIQGVPYAFSLLFMGLTLSAITRFWTQYRYNRQKHDELFKNTINTFKKDTPFGSLKTLDKIPDVFSEFKA